ncbi:hypothetical protein JG687_00016785 [Phytophthora cactorum]|uniref:RxLR effector protein n=1 Tax=Phytophthora cactorum TaxID=29920 RepID=A0A8T1TUZ2_9STRA|nr:hypothetical protein PC120_g25820 [Phytophthora cactorum]KAG3041112.1 hypothetical protein PC121_g23436 [Phytophthora cactorum]KAG4038171.1 hypothetical protein PC123_g26266 [Phytophthora cactorum]KAG6946309.1 hypothetical protein JG687_00016785 [Phytophthora cactorum]
MRFIYLLFVATAISGSTCNASVTVLGDVQAKMSAYTSTDSFLPARDVDASTATRFLRTNDEEDAPEEDDEDFSEERGRATERIAHWVAMGYNDDIPGLIKATQGYGNNDVYRKAFKRFLDKYAPARLHSKYLLDAGIHHRLPEPK